MTPAAPNIASVSVVVKQKNVPTLPNESFDQQKDEIIIEKLSFAGITMLLYLFHYEGQPISHKPLEHNSENQNVSFCKILKYTSKNNKLRNSRQLNNGVMYLALC
jgi:hypothetical protein